jgi:hypothetical protein
MEILLEERVERTRARRATAHDGGARSTWHDAPAGGPDCEHPVAFVSTSVDRGLATV